MRPACLLSPAPCCLRHCFLTNRPLTPRNSPSRWRLDYFLVRGGEGGERGVTRDPAQHG